MLSQSVIPRCRCPPKWGLYTEPKVVPKKPQTKPQIRPLTGRHPPVDAPILIEHPIQIPLKSLHISVKILNNIARTTYTQIYQNSDYALLETEFFFPISPDACFDSFEAKVDGRTVTGIVMKKEEAKEEYKKALNQGHTAAYSEINEETGDIMKILLGNIPPQKEIAIMYSFVQKLETALDKFWCYRLSSTFTPRYNGNTNAAWLQGAMNTDLCKLASYPTVPRSDSEAYPWSIEVEIQSPSPLELVRSPTHKIVCTYGNERHTCNISLSTDFMHVPDRDFILLLNNKRDDGLDYTLTPFEDGYCAMISYLADFERSSAEVVYDNAVGEKEKVKNVEEESVKFPMDTIRGEYIFLLDRSGSMKGDRIKMAKESLSLFLKSLPQDSYFNVISFGKYFTYSSPVSYKYSEHNLQAVLNEILYYEANMGGTNIYEALDFVYRFVKIPGYPRFIFLLTDGAVSNTTEVLNLVSLHAFETKLFTVGVGNGCSIELVTKTAANGRGKHEIVVNNEEIYGKVVNLLNASLSPCFTQLSLQADNFDAIVKGVSPNPSSIPFLLNGEPMTFFLFLRAQALQDGAKLPVKLCFYDSRIQKMRTMEVILEEANLFENEMVPKLAIHDMIKRLEAEKTSKEVLWRDDKEINESLLELSIKNNILCKKTAFFCKILDSNGNSYLEQIKVQIPTTKSVDYEAGHAVRSSGFAVLKKEEKCYKKGASQPFNQTTFGGYQQSSLSINLKEKSKMTLNGSVRASCSARPGSAATTSKSSLQNVKPASSFLNSHKAESLTTTASKRVMTVSKPKISPLVEEKTKQMTYLDVIMKQSFSGCWSSTDKTLLQILKVEKLMDAPKELEKLNESTLDAWITILVLLWLETTCSKDKNAWKLIYQKACDWLKSKDVEYEKMKEFGIPLMIC